MKSAVDRDILDGTSSRTITAAIAPIDTNIFIHLVIHKVGTPVADLGLR